MEERLTSAREIAELAGVSVSTAYRWISGENQPDFNSVRLLLRHLAEPSAQEALLSAFAGGTPWRFSHTELELDVNHDGEVNADDAIDAAIAAVKGAARSLEQIRKSHDGDQLDSDEALHVVAQLNQVVRQCTIAERVVVDLSDHGQALKKQAKLKLAK